MKQLLIKCPDNSFTFLCAEDEKDSLEEASESLYQSLSSFRAMKFTDKNGDIIVLAPEVVKRTIFVFTERVQEEALNV